MGCCGCTNKASTTTAGIFGLIESLIGIILTAYFYNIYQVDVTNIQSLNTSLYLVATTSNASNIIRPLLVISLLLNLTWMCSSIALLIGNAHDNAGAIRQWVVITSFIIIGDIILPVILVISTSYMFQETVNSVAESSRSSSSNDDWSQTVENTINQKVARVRLEFNQYYIFLVMCFSRFGLISLITNICLTVFSNRRVYEIRHPAPAGFLFTAIPVNVVQGQVIQANVGQPLQAFPPNQQPQGYFMQQQYLPEYSHPPPVPVQVQPPNDQEANKFQYAKF